MITPEIFAKMQEFQSLSKQYAETLSKRDEHRELLQKYENKANHVQILLNNLHNDLIRMFGVESAKEGNS